jgi:hypothetical protein
VNLAQTVYSRWPLVIAALATTLATSVARAQAGLNWPVLPEPPYLEAFDIGSQMELHRMPVKIRGYVTNRTVTQTVNWYQTQMSGQWVLNKVGTKTILGHMERDFFITVELEPMLANASTPTTKVVTAVMLVDGSKNASQAQDPALERWASRLPTGSRILSHVVDHEATNSALHLVAVNRQSLAYNVRHFQSEFHRLGYAPNPTFTDQSSSGSSVADAVQPEKLLFTAGNKEAILVVGRNDKGQTTIVLNLFVRKAPS